jgi:WD40 repeat protein
LLYVTYEHELVNTVKPLNPIPRQWSPCLQTLEGHFSTVSSVAFSRDGSKIISGSHDHTVRLWDAVTGVLLKTLSGHRGSVKSVAVSFDDSLIVSGSADHTDPIRVWDMATGVRLRYLEPHSAIWSVSCSPKAHRIVSGGDSHVIQIWDILDGTLLRTLKGHTDEVSSVAFSTSGEWVVSGAQDQTVRLWHAESGFLQATFEGHRGSILSVGFSPDDKRIISGSEDCTARVWDIASGSLVLTRVFDDPVWSVTHFPLTNEVASALGSEIRTWDVATGKVLRTMVACNFGVQFLALSQDGTRMVSGGTSLSVQIWQAQAAFPVMERTWSLTGLLQFSPDGLHAVSSLICRIDIWNAMASTLLGMLKGHTSSLKTMSFSANSVKLISGSDERTIRPWEVDTGIALKKLNGRSALVMSEEFTRNGTRMFASNKDSIQIWDTFTGRVVQSTRIGVHIHFTCAALFPDGQKFAVVVDKVVEIWDLVYGDLQKTLEGYWSQILDIAFPADGTRIASGLCYDGTVHMWNRDAGAASPNLKTQGTPCGLMYSSDERSIFTNSEPIPIPNEFVPTRRPNNADTLPSAHIQGYYMGADGWLWAYPPQRRLCWIPPDWRPGGLMFRRDLLTWRGHHVALGTTDRILCIDTTDLATYLDDQS